MYSKIIYPLQMSFLDYPDNENHCINVYFIGCDFRCKGCQNPNLQSTSCDGTVISIEDFFKELHFFSKKFMTKNVVLSGGDPLAKNNIDFVREFLKKNTQFDVCIYTGNNIDYVKSQNIKGFDYIVCNEYKVECKTKSEKTNNYFQLASTNQEVFNRSFDLISTNGRIIFK